MAIKSDNTGLLSKMAMFVRNSQKNGAETDRAPIEIGSDLDKQTIKAMIERKRQNDLIRRREFAQLRKVRSKNAGTVQGAAAAPSFFQSSFVSSDLEGRADTLKKIDEIEAQMSKQWWKGKQEESRMNGVPTNIGGGAPGTLGTSFTSLSRATGKKFDLPNVAAHLQNSSDLNFVPTVKSNEFGDADHSFHSRDDTDFLSTLKEHDMLPEALLPPDPRKGLGAPMPIDTALEEAAMRFANGDDRGVENGLLTVLRQAPKVHTSEQSTSNWIAALLDFYRSTHNQLGFFSAITEFARYIGSTEPQWEAIGGKLQLAKNTRTGGAIWSSPTQLDATAMEELRRAMYTHPMPWHLDWSQLQHITDDAMPLLAGLFHSLCVEPVTLRCSGVHHLIDCLRNTMHIGDKSINPDWWLMRLNVLRTTQMMDEFELAALDYCVTYEVSPPAWEKARCTYSNVEDDAPETPPPILTKIQAVSDGLNPTMELNGSLNGEATDATLANFHPQEGANVPSTLTISCRHLVRVDFAAAGSILNWAAMRQSEGSLVQFVDVHHLVAVFFHVIGIHEHARIVLRNI